MDFIPTLVTTGPGEDVDYAYAAAAIDVPALRFRERAVLIEASLVSVDRSLADDAVQALVEHPTSGDPAFLGLLLDELHKTPSHADVATRLEELLSAISMDDLVTTVLDRVELDLGLERFADLQAFLALLAESHIGYTEVEIVGVIAQLRPTFGSTELALFRWRLASLLSDVAGTLSVRSPFRAALVKRAQRDDLDAKICAVRLSYFGDEARWLTPRALRELALMSDGPASEALHEIVRIPEGLTALLTAQGSGYQVVLAAIARSAGRRVSDLLAAAASAVGESASEVHLAVAQACHDYGEYKLAVQVLDAVRSAGGASDGVTQNAIVALRGRLALVGECPFTDREWDLLFALGAHDQSANVQVALSGMGTVLAQRGDFFWAKKYFDRATKIAFATGDLVGLVLAGVNSSITALEAWQIRSTVAWLQRYMPSSLRPLLLPSSLAITG